MMETARDIARKFALKAEDEDLFAECWKLRLRSDEAEKNLHADSQTEVEAAFERLAGAALRREVSTKHGHRYVKRAQKSGRYVVFSDHHWSIDDERQNFFGHCGNRALYCDLLAEYYAAGYTLIENGDVEELLVARPTKAEIVGQQTMTWDKIFDDRKNYRLRRLRAILDAEENKRLYGAIGRFHDTGRYLKIAGNHDVDLQDAEFLTELRRRYRDIPTPYDYVLLEDKGGTVHYAIMHGHQFDLATNPVVARYVGQTISETMSWAYQGADRIWKWDDGPSNWAKGSVSLANELVDDDYDPTRGGIFDMLWAAADCLHDPDAWEALFKHNIAWEYFENDDPQKAIDLEVKTGDEWFKFRHLDEVAVVDHLRRWFPDESTRPKLVLGHSHEPRIRPSNATYYLNSAAAGRFENLIWGLEIVDGSAQMVGWYRADGPGKGSLARQVFEHFVSDKGKVRLRAAGGPTPLS